MTRLVRSFLLLEAASFFAASSVHSGILFGGYEHSKAATAESVIGAVLAIALVVTVLAPRASRTVGLAAQAFALLGTAVGLFTIAIGVGPRTAPDLVFHVAIIAVLVVGLFRLQRRRSGAAQGATP
jgi:hypothetical protein